MKKWRRKMKNISGKWLKRAADLFFFFFFSLLGNHWNCFGVCQNGNLYREKAKITLGKIGKSDFAPPPPLEKKIPGVTSLGEHIAHSERFGSFLLKCIRRKKNRILWYFKSNLPKFHNFSSLHLQYVQYELGQNQAKPLSSLDSRPTFRLKIQNSFLHAFVVNPSYFPWLIVQNLIVGHEKGYHPLSGPVFCFCFCFFKRLCELYIRNQLSFYFAVYHCVNMHTFGRHFRFACFMKTLKKTEGRSFNK